MIWIACDIYDLYRAIFACKEDSAHFSAVAKTNKITSLHLVDPSGNPAFFPGEDSINLIKGMFSDTTHVYVNTFSSVCEIKKHRPLTGNSLCRFAHNKDFIFLLFRLSVLWIILFIWESRTKMNSYFVSEDYISQTEQNINNMKKICT